MVSFYDDQGTHHAAALTYYASLEAQFEKQRADLEAEKARFDALVVQLQRQYDSQARGYGGGSGQFGWPEQGLVGQPHAIEWPLQFGAPERQELVEFGKARGEVGKKAQ